MSLTEGPRGGPSPEDEVELAREVDNFVLEDHVVLTPLPPIEEVIILVPALDEERGIGNVLDTIPFQELQDMGCEVSVLVVDGESTDATREIAEEKGAHVFVQSGRGKGNGVRQAFGRIVRHQSDARCLHHRQSVIMVDADGTYPVEDIPLILDALRAGNDVVMGSRLLGKIETGAMTGLNEFGNRMLSLLARVLFGAPVTDVCTGMWGFSEEFLQQCELQAKGFELEAEIFASAALLGARITEVPIDYRVRHGEPKMIPIRTGAQIAWCLLRKRFESVLKGPARILVRVMQGQGFRHESLSSDS
ncbi:MAG TPA: glycosyltransferase family 2 protein [Thermoplasmata archaeon]|nr:glycosyltransferase family 2 protein [Thermoplasmata archaeon]